MKSELPQQIVGQFIELGRRENLDEPSITADFEQFRSYEYVSRMHWQDWYPTCERLSNDDHTVLMKRLKNH